jgi:hypothetical protein
MYQKRELYVKKKNSQDMEGFLKSSWGYRQALVGVMPLTMNAYKVEMAKTLIKRAILS